MDAKECCSALRRTDQAMPYERNEDLPKVVRNNLPSEAQIIYRKTFNSAWEQYGRRDKRRAGVSREETAHRVAWAAVKGSYEKRGDHWVKIRREPR